MGEVLIDRDNAVELTELGIQLEAVEDKIIIMMDSYKSGYECKTCGGAGKVKSSTVEGATKDCSDCNGKGATLVIPETAKSLPTLGTVVSMGEKTKWATRKEVFEKAQEHYLRDDVFDEDRFKLFEKQIRIRPGAKVIFQPHVGTLIPFKGNIRLKIMREHEPLAVLYGVNVDVKDFLDFDVPFENRY